MKGFDSKFLTELKLKCDIADVVGRYVHLERRGGNFWGRCPFHHEKTPSFCVNEQEQFYYCFGCHKSGDVITFVKEMESVDFSDAVKILAEKAKMPLPEVEYDDEKVKEQKRKRQRVLDLLRDAAMFYVHNLSDPRAGKHIEYIYKRNLTSATVTRFGLGASLDYDGLPTYLKKKGYTKEEMTASGAVGEKNGRVYDALAGRLIIPVIDAFNNVVAFCGRIIEKKENVGKYVNTKETIVFSKGKTLFNINNVKKVKNEEGIKDIIIVEGHMDVISLVQAGIKNVVASMGTALTKDQARLLKRYVETVYICYDDDFAGQKATIRGLEILKEEGLDVKVISLPDGMDPDDAVNKLGADGYRQFIVGAKPLIDFKIDVLKKTFDVKTTDGKRKFVTAALKVIKESPSAAEQEDLLKEVRDLTGITFESLKRELFGLEESDTDKQETVTPTFSDDSGDKTLIAARFVLASYIFGKPYAYETDINELTFTLPVHNEIKDYINAKEKAGEKVRFNDLYESLAEEGEEELSRLAGLETEENKQFDKTVYFADCVRILKIAALNDEMNKLISLAKTETDVERRKELTVKISELLNKKNKLANRRYI